MADAIIPPGRYANAPELRGPLPDHKQLPESDGTFVKNFQEHPQAMLLTDALTPILQARHPNGNYAIGQDCGIYWRIAEPPERGSEAPDWFYVSGVPSLLDGEVRRSYVLWQEYIAPLIALEFASGDGREERDATPIGAVQDGQRLKPGKFWVYEQAIRIPFYGVFVIQTGELAVYRLLDGRYQRMEPNAAGRCPIPPLAVELGVWQGRYQNLTQPWLRWWSATGKLLPTGGERADRLAAKLRELGVDPDEV